MLRLLGALFVLAGAGGLGHLMACGLEEHAAVLRRFVAALQHLESDIVFASLPLPLALRRAAQTMSGGVGAFLEEVSTTLVQSDGKPLAATWKAVLGRHAPELLLETAEIEVLEGLGAALGGSDREDQAKHLALARTTLQGYSAEAQTRAEKGKRIWRYLGFSAGALAVILLY